MKSIKIKTPAKINLALDVTGKREDGYHTLETIFQTVSLYDIITVTMANNDKIFITSNTNRVPLNEKNIAWKAVEEFCSYTGKKVGLHIHIEKRIPSQAGLGGGSSDGAAVLFALNRLTNAGLSRYELCKIGIKLGADVPFFFFGGTAYASGIGEKLEPLKPIRKIPLVVAKGAGGISTATAYQAIDSLENPNHPKTNELKQGIETGGTVKQISSLCGNLFEDVTKLSAVSKIRAEMLNQGALCSVMTGSGSAVFGIFDNVATARKCCSVLRKYVSFAVCCETYPKAMRII